MNAATGIRTQATGATSRGHAPRLWRRSVSKKHACPKKCRSHYYIAADRHFGPSKSDGHVGNYFGSFRVAYQSPRPKRCLVRDFPAIKKHRKI